MSQGIDIVWRKPVIENGNTQSTTAVNLDGLLPVGVVFPTGWSGGTTLTFQASNNMDSDGTYVSVVDSNGGAAISLTAAADTYAIIQGPVAVGLSAVKYVKVTCGSATSADETVTLVCRRVA